MRARICKVLAGLVVVAGAVGAVFVAGFRTKSPLVLNAIRRGLRATRPTALKSSGTPGAYASIISHTGRVTGRSYETPVQAVPTGDGFVVALPYGSNTDWLKNVVAAGSATIVHDGERRLVERPEIVPMESVAACFPLRDQRAHRLFGIDQCLLVRTVRSDSVSLAG